MRVPWLLLALPACSLLTSLDELAGDGGTPPPPPGSACTQDATFCDDFSEQPPDASFFPLWTSRNGSGDVHRTMCGTTPCLAVSTPAGPEIANLIKNFNTPATNIHYAFDLQVTQYPTVGSANTMQIEATVNLPTIELIKVYLEFHPTAAKFSEQSGAPDGAQSVSITQSFPPPQTGTWTHFDVVVDLPSGTMTLAINDAGLPSQTIPSADSSTPAVFAGVGFETVTTDHFAMNVTNTIVWLQ